MKKLKINIASSHRFHLLDLARELERQGHDVRFYSYVPSNRCEKFGFDKKHCVCLLPYVAAFFALAKFFPNATCITKWRNIVMDFIVGHFMRRCDVYIALGTVYLESFTLAKKRYGAITILEWGSKHVDEQQRILASIGATLNKEYFNIRSRKAYDIVDYIAVASEHVVRSFLKHGYKREKFLKNPYGVDLSMFHPEPNVEKEYDVIMTGNWSLQKGCDLIVDALKGTKFKFLHVGSLVDVPFPDAPNFTHVDAVDQTKLQDYYAKAKVFVLPSRQEGLAMVQAQAIACNLPLVGSCNSGAEDLKNMVDLQDYITLIDEYTPAAVLQGVENAIKKYTELDGKVYAGSAIDNLTWQAYGERYAKFVTGIMQMGGVTLLPLMYKYDVLMVGGWSYRKGCDLLVEALKDSDLTLLHVGSVVDMNFPQLPNFKHINAVDQSQLVNFYHKAKIFALPSREEGLAMVQVQAIACDLPVVGSMDSGAEDLRDKVERPECISLVTAYTPSNVKETICHSLSEYDKKKSMCYAGNIREELSWQSYGSRYSSFLNAIYT